VTTSATGAIWDLLEAALADHRSVAIVYDGHERIIYPHALD
jgi:hypothetical protein